MKTLRFVIICAATLLVAACSGKKDGAEPADVVSGFHKALTSLEFGKASEYCCEGAVSGYVAAFEKACEEALAKDSGATQIAAGMLSTAEVTVNDIKRDKDARTVFYTIGDGCGNTKEKVAVLKDVEGEWKIAEIKDR